MDIISLYEDWARDAIQKDENGVASYEMFNRMVKRGSLRLLNYITGDQSGQSLPLSYSTEKAKGFISFLITPYRQQVVDGLMAKPDDYYMYENLYIMALKDNSCEEPTGCDTEDNPDEIIYTAVEMLDGQQFIVREQTYIELLKPSAKKPIAKEVGANIEFLPKDVGNAKLEYIRYPIAGTVNSVYDATYNDQIANAATSINSEWPEFARELLLYFMTDMFANNVSQQSMKQNNIITQQLPGGK